MVDGAALEKRCAKAPRVRIPPSPPLTIPSVRPMPAMARPRARPRGRPMKTVGPMVERRTHPTLERSPSGLWRRTGNAVWGNPSRVRIPPSPPLPVVARRAAVDCAGRARRGTSGALYLQSAPAGLNPLPRSPSPNAARRCDVEDRVPRSGEPRTVSGPEGSSTKRPSPGAAERPGPSRSSWWARGRVGRRRVHGNSPPLAQDRRNR